MWACTTFVYPYQALLEQRSFVRSRTGLIFLPVVSSSQPSFSPQGIAAGLLPYCLRACRLVVLFNTQYRLKYARYVKQRNIAKISVIIGTGVVIGAFLVLYNMPERYARYNNCRYWQVVTMKLATVVLSGVQSVQC